MEVRGHPDYLITNKGSIISKKTNKILKLDRDRLGYKTKLLNGKRYRVDILVAEHYIPNPSNKPHIKHKNSCIQDNNVDNLEWVDSSVTEQYSRIVKNKTHDYKNISYCKKLKNYQYDKKIKHIKYFKSFKTLKEALCYKFIFILKMRAGLI
tara:strand:+ start:276 stop:731 length:456 start_codon:yes stop_codon:yes gene_type:complete